MLSMAYKRRDFWHFLKPKRTDVISMSVCCAKYLA